MNKYNAVLVITGLLFGYLFGAMYLHAIGIPEPSECTVYSIEVKSDLIPQGDVAEIKVCKIPEAAE